ncbi:MULTISPECIES: hypothetical protein [Bradyrhizobium]|uniref:hypothetical protein n=1 Tax=Bradyrhizobium TaxID=374 RepID=UPI0004B96192
MARDAVLSAPLTGDRQEMVINVRDAGGPVMQVTFYVEIEDLTSRSRSRDH